MSLSETSALARAVVRDWMHFGALEVEVDGAALQGTRIAHLFSEVGHLQREVEVKTEKVAQPILQAQIQELRGKISGLQGRVELLCQEFSKQSWQRTAAQVDQVIAGAVREEDSDPLKRVLGVLRGELEGIGRGQFPPSFDGLTWGGLPPFLTGKYQEAIGRIEGELARVERSVGCFAWKVIRLHSTFFTNATEALRTAEHQNAFDRSIDGLGRAFLRALNEEMGSGSRFENLQRLETAFCFVVNRWLLGFLAEKGITERETALQELFYGTLARLGGGDARVLKDNPFSKVAFFRVALAEVEAVRRHVVAIPTEEEKQLRQLLSVVEVRDAEMKGYLKLNLSGEGMGNLRGYLHGIVKDACECLAAPAQKALYAQIKREGCEKDFGRLKSAIGAGLEALKGRPVSVEEVAQALACYQRGGRL